MLLTSHEMAALAEQCAKTDEQRAAAERNRTAAAEAELTRRCTELARLRGGEPLATDLWLCADSA